jgi:hypothetical protein
VDERPENESHGRKNAMDDLAHLARMVE